jgi:hypothetical protein
VARHSGLADIASGLEAEYSTQYRSLASFQRGDLEDLTETLRTLLALPASERQGLGEAARRAAVRHWSWEHIGALILSGPWETPSA